MKDESLTTSSLYRWQTVTNTVVVWIFVTLTVLLTIAVLLLPLPVFAGPALVVFFQTIIATILIRLTEGKGRIRAQLFSAQS